MAVRGGGRTRRRGGAGKTGTGKKYTKFGTPPSKAVERVIPKSTVEHPECPACQARAELAAKTATYKAKPWWKRMTQRHPGKKAEKEAKKNTKKAADAIDSGAAWEKRQAGERHVERMGELGLNLDGFPVHSHTLRETPTESAAGGRKRRRRTRRGRKGRKGRKIRRTRRR